jgi:hypothetical protein
MHCDCDQGILHSVTDIMPFSIGPCRCTGEEGQRFIHSNLMAKVKSITELNSDDGDEQLKSHITIHLTQDVHLAYVFD